ncbi:MAG: hypothetical protein GTN76_12120 [Candidatus Aenigmarchaeota archaeon]|nr:hypothetical protein [Candidatus Aenigmarchaeota archaeon]
MKKAAKTDVKEEVKGGKYLETDIDELYEMVKKNGLVKIEAAAKKFNVKREQIEEWGRILEEHHLAILHYPPFGDPVLILKKFKPKAEVKKKGVKIKNRKALFINILIIMVFVFIVLWYTGRLSVPSLPDLSSISGTNILDLLTQNQIYLVLALIIIIVLLLIVTLMKGMKKRGKGKGKHGKKRGKGKDKKL